MSNPILLANGPASGRILVAHEPLAYRTALAAALRLLRPHLAVALVAPADLDGELTGHGAALVFCDRVSVAVETHARAWVLLYPDGASRVVMSVDGTRESLPDLGLDTALALVDQVTRSPPAGEEAAPRR